MCSGVSGPDNISLLPSINFPKSTPDIYGTCYDKTVDNIKRGTKICLNYVSTLADDYLLSHRCEYMQIEANMY